ncbi:hypothetical protein V7O67_09560 [Methanolobus sp. ZRKC4]|uniref:hypothetical protein n=1 Tax=Methanolobus sp. ZRKC4 TaxID=3125787 RepID=UPI00324A357E
MVIMLAVITLSGNIMANAMGDENCSDHSADNTQPGTGDIGPGESNENISPAED